MQGAYHSPIPTVILFTSMQCKELITHQFAIGKDPKLCVPGTPAQTEDQISSIWHKVQAQSARTYAHITTRLDTCSDFHGLNALS